MGGTTTLSSDGSAGGTWSSGDVSIATVDASSGVVSGVNSGTVTITYTASGAGCTSSSATIDVSVNSSIYMPSNSSAISVTTCSANLYDDGGPSANYSTSASGTVTIYPATAGQFVNIVGTLFSETNWDELFVYDGTSTGATELTPSGGISGGGGVAIDYTASNVDGALTVVFTSDGSYNLGGFDFAVSCVSPCSGTPAIPTASMTLADNCSGTQAELSVSGIESGSGITYDWEASSDLGATWTSTGLPNTTIFSTGDDYYWRYSTTCSNSGETVYSNVLEKLAATITSDGDITVCPGDAINLAATSSHSSTFDVEWYAAASGGTALGTGTPYSPSPSVTTTYYAASSGCPDTRVAVIANISELTSAYGDASTCTGVDATLTGTYTGNGVTFSWSPTTGLSDATAAVPTSSSATGLTYTLTLTDELSCSITDDVVLTITESTAGTLSATSTTFAVAETSTVSTDGTTGGSFTSSDDAVATVDVSTGVVTGVSAGSVTITYTTPECSGQTFSNTINLTIACNAGTVSLSSASINIASTSTASTDGTSGGSWSSDNTSVATVDASTGVVTGVSAGSANIVYTTSTACGSETSSAVVSVTCISDLVVSYDDVEHCGGNSSTLTGTVSDPGESYTYTFNGIDSYGDGWNGASVDILVDGTTVVSGFAVTGSSGAVTFQSSPGLPITLSWTSGSYNSEISWDVRFPTNATLNSGNYGETTVGSPNYSTASYTYSWSPTTDLDDATSATPVSSVTTTTNYTVTVTNNQGCTGTDAVAVTVSNPTAGTLSGTQSIAPAGTTTISTDGTSGGTFSSSDDAVATVDASTGVVTGVTAGTVTITYTTPAGCPEQTATIVITVACASDLVVSFDDAEHCGGNSSTLTGTVSDPDESYTYTFNGIDAYGDGWNGASVDILVDGTTVVSGFAVAAASDAVTFQSSPGLPITLSWTSGSYNSEISWDVRFPTNATLNSGNYGETTVGSPNYSTASYTYSWSPTTDLDDATSATPVSTVTSSTNYTVTVTNQNGCTGTDAVAVTVSNPTAGTLSGTTTVAPGGTTTISSDGTSGGVWSSDNTSVATVDASTGVVTAGVAGSASITYAVGGTACPDDASITVNVVCGSNLVVTYDDAEHCSGNSSTLSGTVSNPNVSAIAYTFNGIDSWGDGWNGGAVDIVVDGAVIESGFTVSGSSASVSFNAFPASVITLVWTAGSYPSEISFNIVDGNSNVLSSGNTSTTAGGTVPGSAPTYTYSWSPSNDLDDASIASPTSSVATTTNYTITVTDNNGCTGTDAVAVTVSNPTAGTLSGTTTIAPEGTTTISSDGTTGGVWESDDTAVATVDASTGVVTGGIAGSATITYTVGGTACPDASTITVNVVCDAYTVVYDDVTFCDGTPTTLSQTSNSQNSTYEFYGVDSWGDGWNGASLDISVNGVTVLTGVEVTASNVSAYFDAPAGATIGFDWTPGSYNSEISWGLYDASVNLLDNGAYGDVSSSIPGSAPTYTYSWSPSTGLDDASIMEPTSSASTTIVYTVTVTDGFGCVATDDVTATVNPLYTPTVTIVSSDADNEICSGDAVTFTATAVDAGNPTYVWNIGGSPVSGETASTFTTTTLADGDEVTVTVTADNTCQTVNEVTSTGITTTVNAVTAGTIEASVDGATTYASTPQVIQVGNDIYWEYTAGSATGTFSSFEFQWQGTTNTWNENFGGGANPYNWGAGQTLNPGQTLYVRAKAACGSNAAYSDPVAVDWLTCYGGTTEIATSTSDGGSIVDGGNMTVNSTISWTAPTDAFGDAYHWEYSWDGGSSFNGEWQNNTNPATWSDNIGSQADNTLTIRYVSTGSGSCSDNATADFDVTVLRPVITVSAISGDLAVCSDGEASSSETFTVEGLYIANDDNAPAAAASHTGILVTAPSGLEISTDNSTFSSTINLSATNGTVSQTTIYARIIAGQGASDVSGDIACTAQAANTQNVSAVATIDENAEIETSVSFTGTTTCGEVSIDVQVNGVSAGSGAWTALSGLFLSATDVATTFTTSTFGSTITLTWTSSNGACTGETTSMDVEFNQPTTSTIDGYGMDTECWIWGGLTDDDWSEPSNWYAYTTDLNNNSYWERQTVNVPSATDKVYIMANSDAGQCISSSNSAIATPGAAVTDLMVANGATLNLSGATSIKGDLTNDGTINAGSSTLTFDGTSDQTVSGNALTLDNLTVNKTSGNLIMSTPINVNGLLDLSSDVNNGSNVLSVGTSSASLGSIEQNGGIVLGKLRRYFANASGSKSFPVGIAGTMRDVAVDFVSAPGTDQYITASYNTGYPQANDGSDLYEGLPLTTSDNQLIQNYDDEGYWEIIPGSSSTGDSYIAPINGKQYNVTLHCNNLTGADNVTNMDRTKVRMIKSAGPGHTSWEALTHVSISGDDADFLLTATGTGFSFFGAGTEDDNALPVELISFSGDCNDGVVDLIWQTASEQNSEDFEIEYSRDGVDWSLVHAEPAAGFSNELITYNFSHKQAISGNNYYRLTQNDIDGTATIYNNLIINASCQSTSNGYFSVFPNPSSGNFQVIMNNPEIEGAAQLRIVDTKGNEVFMKSIEVNSGINMFVIQQDLAPGIYYINIENSSRTTNVVKHSIR